MFVTLALTAVLFETALGYPDAVWRRIGHPVSWMGALIARLDAGLNLATLGFAARRARGVLALLVLLAITTAAALAISAGLALAGDLAGAILTALVAGTLIAQRSLHAHVADVAAALERDGLAAGRTAVSRIVGRDPQTLDEAGVCRAAIESVAENFSDGVVAPVLWLTVAGLPGAALYKAINTADSMIGHLSERHRAFGWAAARLDDLVNIPASRLSAALLAAAAALDPKASGNAALDAVEADARKHRSPNAGWPEAAMAGALELRLAGPRVYAGTPVEDRWMGRGRNAATPADIRRALALYRRACALQIVGLATLAIVIEWLA